MPCAWVRAAAARQRRIVIGIGKMPFGGEFAAFRIGPAEPARLALPHDVSRGIPVAVYRKDRAPDDGDAMRDEPCRGHSSVKVNFKTTVPFAVW